MRLFIAMSVIALSLIGGAAAQNTPSTEKLIYHEHLTNVTALLDSVMYPSVPDTTDWIPFGTRNDAADSRLKYLRTYNPRRFSLFTWMDSTAGGNTSGAADLLVTLQIALDTTGTIGDSVKFYENQDSTCTIDTVHYRDGVGWITPLPVYGGNYLRFILEATDTTRVNGDLWTAH